VSAIEAVPLENELLARIRGRSSIFVVGQRVVARAWISALARVIDGRLQDVESFRIGIVLYCLLD
jgi:hypothetical protein